ncbi:8232_t:CDS:2, partial [Racocetra persica]
LFLGYRFCNSEWRKCNRKNIVHIWPKSSPQRNGPYHLAEIENELTNLSGLSVDNVEEFANNDELQETDNEEFEEKIKEDWMILAEIGSNTTIDCSSNLSLSNTDQNYDWIGDVKQHYPNFNLNNADTFVQQILDREAINNINLIPIDYQTLNKIQKSIFKRIVSHYNESTSSQIELLRIIIMRTVEIDKLYLINAIWQKLQEMIKDT